MRTWGGLLRLSVLLLVAIACNLSFTIPDGEAPRPPLVFIAPESGSQIAEGAPIQLAVRAEDTIGVARIDFAVDGVALGSQEATNGQPQKVFTALQVWQSTTISEHLLTASAFRANNELIGTANITVRIVALTTPGAQPTQIAPTDTPAPTIPPTEPVLSPTPFLSPTPVTNPTTPPSNQPQARIITPFLNVRSGPGANYSGIGQVKAGDIVIILGRNDDRKWWAVQGPTGLRGWILNNPAYIEVSGDVSTVPLAAAKPSPTPG